ncbi:MAG: MFS transporter [Candidatus Eremiobacteraeota bacterium]|nr:MFS transporter [Candidatus Eremiobacteraeota bacterium]
MPPSPKPALLAAYWFGIQALWGALLGISLQARSIELHPAHALIAYGQLATIGAIVATVVQLLMGVYSDRLRAKGRDRRLFFVAGAALGSIGILAFYLAPTFSALIVSLIFLQVGMNTAVGPYQAIIPDYLPTSVAGMASSWMAGFQSLGNAAGAVAAAMAAQLLLPGFSIALALVIMLVATCAVTVSHIAKLSPRPVEKAHYRVGGAAIDLFLSRAFLWVGFYTMLGYMLFYVQDTLRIAGAQFTTGIVIIIFTLSGALGAALSAKPTDRLDRRMVVNVSTSLFILSLVLFIMVRNMPVMFGAAALAGVGWGGFLAADWALGCAILPRGMMATAMGVWNIAVAGPQIAAPILATGLLLLVHPGKAAAPPLAFALAVAEVALGTLWIWRLPPQTRLET